MTRKIIVLIWLFFAAVSLFAQVSLYTQSSSARQPYWLTLEQGKISFRNGDYGRALLLFEDARRDRREMYEQMEQDLINFLSRNEVRRVMDSLEIAERYAKDMHFYAVTAALEELYYRIPKESLNNSSTAALEAVGRLKDFPEAEYWIGEVFRVEGELPLALSQYRKAYSLRDNFEDPGFSITLQYKISDILRVRLDYSEMETSYLSIINNHDRLWVNASTGDTIRANNAANPTPVRRTATINVPAVPYEQASASLMRHAMTRTLEGEGVTRFLELYRYNNSIVEPAHRELGFYYAAFGRPLAQQHLTFAFLIQNTIIIEELIRRQFDFTFTDLETLAQAMNKNPLLVSYVEEVEYYKTIYHLGMSLYWNGRQSVGRSLWTFLSTQPQAGEWQRRAIMQLREPRMEAIAER